MLSDEEVVDYQPLFNNARRLRELMIALHELPLQLVEPADARSHPKLGTQLAHAVTRSR